VLQQLGALAVSATRAIAIATGSGESTPSLPLASQDFSSRTDLNAFEGPITEMYISNVHKRFRRHCRLRKARLSVRVGLNCEAYCQLQGVIRGLRTMSV
jgi:hypothetical protein